MGLGGEPFLDAVGVNCKMGKVLNTRFGYLENGLRGEWCISSTYVIWLDMKNVEGKK